MIVNGDNIERWPLWSAHREEHLVLDALSIRRWKRPYRLYKHIVDNTDFCVSMNTIIETLNRFEREGFAEWEEFKGISVYRITNKGCNHLFQLEIRHRGPLQRIQDLSINTLTG